MTYSYTAYGLRIESALELPELVPADGAADVVIRLGDEAGGDASAPGITMRSEPRRTTLAWAEAGEIRILDGREIEVRPAPAAPPEVLRAFLLGQALPTLLVQRGLHVLHASSVGLGGRAVAFLGGGGFGKSTLAAALYDRGWAFVADDAVAVELRAKRAWVLPAFPQFRLWPDAATHLGLAPDRLVKVRPSVEKRLRPAADGFIAHPLPLECVYALARGDVPRITMLQPRETLLQLIANSWHARRDSVASAHARLGGYAVLAEHLRVRRLERPPRLADLAEVMQLVEDDLSRAAVA